MTQQNGKSRPVEVQPRATRRRFSAEYKRRILAEADACPRGQVGALLRREGLYYSHLTKWRGEREAGTLADRPRGPRPNPERGQMDRLAQENATLKRKLEQAEAIIEAQKKLARLLDSRESEGK
jgi:transposase-like protein